MKACRSPDSKSRLCPARRGAILVFAMIALLVTTMIGASLLRTAVTSMRQIQREQQQIQAGWLAEAGCQRALAKTAADGEYQGETWDVPAEQLLSPSGATVRITVETGPEANSPRTMTAIAEYPKSSNQAIRVTKRIIIPVAAPAKPK